MTGTPLVLAGAALALAIIAIALAALALLWKEDVPDDVDAEG